MAGDPWSEVLASVDLGVLVVGRDATIIAANRAAEALLRPTGALVGSRLEVFLPDEARAAHGDHERAFWDHPAARPMSGGRVLPARRGDGAIVDLGITIAPSTVADAPVAVVVMMEATAGIVAHSELRRRSDALQQSNEALERFAWATSHDLQEPLRMIASYTQLLARRYGEALDDDGRQMVAYTFEGAQRLQELIDDLLSYARVGRAALVPVPVAAIDEWEVARTLLALAIAEAGAEVVVDGELPVVMAEPVLLRQIWQNLLSNALKFRGPQPPEVHVGCSGVADGFARLYVRDNGVGIAPEQLDRVFEPFVRLGERTGNGIGLALCKSVVTSLGGSIGVGSRSGEGSTFWFTLPVAKGGS